MLYCSHAIFYFKLLEAAQDSFLVHENIYLIEAEDEETAARLAVDLAKANEDTSEDGHLELNEQKAAYLFAGIRKIIEVASSPMPINAAGLVGLELSYSQFEVDTLDQVLALARGDMVEVLYRE
ncbi:hypothetical protein HNQ51_002193 [Inhella inkyongensis]|uniref:DUF4288 domain-containing protein n=1 Tax=Inhella inkyongensis TaxID=392593 RepID=A0A840S7W1_9BURK|nr:DUF4288 domain-containing protein [Inhella inkyongensis]MBB5204874.1 hypothetical protein [Inhella inkyongensis]